MTKAEKECEVRILMKGRIEVPVETKGSENDIADAEKHHERWPALVRHDLEEMRRRQRLFDGPPRGPRLPFRPLRLRLTRCLLRRARLQPRLRDRVPQPCVGVVVHGHLPC